MQRESNLDTARLEQDTLGLAQRMREEFLPAMTELQLDVQPPELSRDASAGSSASAEIILYVRRQGDIVDAIEFCVHRKGEAISHPDELERWLRSTFNDVLRRQR